MDHIYQYISDFHSLLDRLPVEPIEKTIVALYEARLRGKQVFTMGNGGSASTATHFVCDLAKNTRKDGWPPFRVIGLADNIAILSAYANDEGYEYVFAQQLANLVQPGDVVIGISTSGKSPNVLHAIELANKMGAKTIGFTGFNGGSLSQIAGIDIHVPSTCIEQVEDVHLMLEHLICKALKENLEITPISSELCSSVHNELIRNQDLHELVRRLLKLTMDGIGASSGSMLVLDKQGEVVEGAMVYDGQVFADKTAGFMDIIQRGLAGWVVENRQAALVVSTRDDPRWLRRSWDEDGSASRSAISVPLMAEDRVVGVLTLVQPQPGRFSRNDLGLLTALAVCMSLVNYVAE